MYHKVMSTSHTLLIVGLVFAALSCGSSSTNGKNTTGPQEETTAGKKPLPKKPKPKFAIKDLLKTTVTIKGVWKESDVFFDDKGSWHCSGVVQKVEEGQLVVVTNKHCTGLHKLAGADPVGGPDVKTWSLVVHTHNARKFKAQSISVAKNMDLAVIRTVKAHFKKGRDYILPPPMGKPAIGDEVLAIGSPVDPKYSGTVTFGRVSALRETFIQHDAAINPGNSGGPLYTKGASGRFVFAGVNTYKLMGSRFQGVTLEGLSFAISILELSSGVYIEAPVDKKGACLLIRGLMKKKCSVK